MNIELSNDEKLIKSWDYATVKGTQGGKSTCNLTVTDKRIINVISNGNFINIDEVKNDSIVGYDANYARKSALTSILWMVVGVLVALLNIFVIKQNFVYGIAAALVVIGVVLFLLRPSQLVLVLYTKHLFNEVLNIGVSGAKKSKKAKTLKVKVNAETAREIVLTINQYLN